MIESFEERMGDMKGNGDVVIEREKEIEEIKVKGIK